MISRPIARNQNSHITIPQQFNAIRNGQPGQSGGEPLHSKTLRDSSRHPACRGGLLNHSRPTTARSPPTESGLVRDSG